MYKIGIALLSLFLVVGSANAATQIKIATLVPKSTGWGTKIDEARAAIKEQTEGRVILKVYYGGG